MKYKKINIAIIGGGINSTIGRAHISALRIDSNYKIIAGVFSRSKKDNKKNKDIYKLDDCQIYNNIDELIKYELRNIDAFLIITDTTCDIYLYNGFEYYIFLDDVFIWS